MRGRRERDVVAWVKRHRATIFSCLTFVVFMQAGFILGRNHDPWVSRPRHHQHHASPPSSNLQYAIPKLQADAAAFASHPISRHMHQAEQLYAAEISSQSTTLAAAVKEYKRRYKRAPPAGFDKWVYAGKVRAFTARYGLSYQLTLRRPGVSALGTPEVPKFDTGEFFCRS